MINEDLSERLEKYFQKARLKFDSIQIISDSDLALKILKSANNYFTDAQHFREKGDLISSLAALEYAEGWVDAGRSMGLLTADHTGEL